MDKRERFFESCECICNDDVFCVFVPTSTASNVPSNGYFRSSNEYPPYRKFSFSVSTGKLLEPPTLAPSLAKGTQCGRILQQYVREMKQSHDLSVGALCFDTLRNKAWHFNTQGYVQCYANLGTCRYATSQDISLRSYSNDYDTGTRSTQSLAFGMAKNIITSVSYRAEPYMERFHSWTSESFPCMMAWKELKSKFLVFELSDRGMTNLSNMLSEALLLTQKGIMDLSICLRVLRILRLHVDRFREVCVQVHTNIYNFKTRVR